MRVVRIIAIVVGAIAFAWAVRKLGWSGLTSVLVKTGPWFLVIAVIDIASALCDAGAIRSFSGRQVSYARALVAQLAGVAINRVTPGNALGEPLKISVISERVSAHVAVSTILMFDVAAAIVAITAMVVGIPITLLLADLPANIALAAWIGAGVLVALAVTLFVVLQRGLVRSGIETLRRLRIIRPELAERWRPTAAKVDGMVHELEGGRARFGILCLFGSRAFNWVGTIVMLHAMGQPITPAMVVGLLSVGALVTYVSHVVPLGLGIAEGGNYLLYRALGAAGLAGLDFTVVYRARTCSISAIGLTVLAITSYRDRRRRATVIV